jgi:hypothetical protein
VKIIIMERTFSEDHHGLINMTVDSQRSYVTSNKPSPVWKFMGVSSSAVVKPS